MSLQPLGIAMLGSFGAMELGIILVIVLVIFGVGKLPQIGDALGKGIRNFKRATTDKEDTASLPGTPGSKAVLEEKPPAYS